MAGWLNSINYMIMVVFGGMGSLTGSIVSAIGLTILPELLRASQSYRMLAYSVVLVLVMIFRPQGIFGSGGSHCRVWSTACCSAAAPWARNPRPAPSGMTSPTTRP